MPVPPADRVRCLLEVAGYQHGVALSSQIRECGFGSHDVTRLVADGWLRRIRLGAYAVGATRSRWQETVAALLLAGDGAALSHETAAAIHRFPLLVPATIPEVTIEAPRHPELAGVRVHQVRRLTSVDVRYRSGMRVTAPSRTLVDISSRLDRCLLERVVDEGCIRRLWTVEDLHEVAKRVGSRGRHRTGLLLDILEIRRGEPSVDSALERWLVRILEPFAPFETQYQLVLDGSVILLDVAWPLCRVGVEADGWTVRSRSRGKFDRDREKGNLLVAHGWAVAHITSRMSALQVQQTIARLLPPSATERWRRPVA